MRAMLPQACHLFVLLSLTAAVGTSLEENIFTSAATTTVPSTVLVSYPTRFHAGRTVSGRCGKTRTSGQRRRLPAARSPIMTLDVDPFLELTTTQSRRNICQDGFKCVRGHCRKVEKQICEGDGYVMIRGRCRKLKTRRERTTAATTPYMLETTATSGAVTPEPSSTVMSLPTRCGDGYVIVGSQCRRMLTPGQENRIQSTTASTPILGEAAPTSGATTRGPATTIWFLPYRCRDGYTMVGGRCRKMWVSGQQSGIRTTLPPTPTLGETTTTSGVTSPAPTATMVHFRNRCRDGSIMVGGRCRRLWSFGQQSTTPTTTEVTPNFKEDLFFEPTTAVGVEPTAISPRKRCPDGFVWVAGRCRRVIKGVQRRSADFQPPATSEEMTDSAIKGSDATPQRYDWKWLCPNGSRYKSGSCLTGVLLRAITLPKRHPDRQTYISDMR